MTNMGKTEGIFLNLQCDCHRVASIFIKTDQSTYQFQHLTARFDSAIGLYRDVWIAAIASSRTRLATLTGAMCTTSQCELRSIRVNSGMFNVIRIVTLYTMPPLESPTSSWIAMAISR